jgi:hypothetical protein
MWAAYDTHERGPGRRPRPLTDDPARTIAFAALHHDGEAAPRKRFSDILGEIAAQERDRVSIRDILAVFGDRAVGALMLLFALPNAFPTPPGTSTVLCTPVVFIAAQLMIGREALWLPRLITERSISRLQFAAIVERLTPWLRRAERALKPRLTFLVGPVQDRLIGLACLALAIVLVLPIPFGNMLPALAISVFALGLIERDGAAIAAGWVGTLASFGVLAALSAALVAAAEAFIVTLGRLFA